MHAEHGTCCSLCTPLAAFFEEQSNKRAIDFPLHRDKRKLGQVQLVDKLVERHDGVIEFDHRFLFARGHRADVPNLDEITDATRRHWTTHVAFNAGDREVCAQFMLLELHSVEGADE